MKCPSCGAETQGKFCKYCGSEMPQEKPQVGGCPKCGSTNVTFKRERVGTSTRRSSHKNILGTGRTGQSVSQSAYRTVGLCQNCGFTWNPNAANQGSGRKTWLWVLGWIFIFPVPLTILMLRKKDMRPAVKYGIIAAAWLLFFVIGMSGNSETDTPQTDVPDTTIQTEPSISTTQATEPKLFESDEIINQLLLNYNGLAENKFTDEQIKRGNINSKANIYETGVYSITIVNSSNGFISVDIEYKLGREDLYPFFRDFILAYDNTILVEDIEKAWTDIQDHRYELDYYQEGNKDSYVFHGMQLQFFVNTLYENEVYHLNILMFE